jgi:hypothetical protein
MRRRTLYQEVWECRFPKRQTIEEELLTLQAIAPDMAEDLYSLFEEAVTDSLANILEESGARALVRLMGEANIESPSEVFAILDSIFHEGSSTLKSAITEEFRMNVHLLLKKVERNLVADSRRLIVPMPRRLAATRP